MFKLSNTTHKTIVFACCVIGLLAFVGAISNVETNSQQLQVLSQNEKDKLFERIRSSAETPFNVIENDDSPFRIIEAKSKEISGEEFTRLTRKTTDLTTVMSVPEVTLLNTSEKTITSFYLGVRNAETQSVRSFIKSKVSVAPGEVYTVTRDYFARPQKVTVSDSKGPRQKWVQPEWDSEKFWLEFKKSPDVFVSVGQVSFADGSEWIVSEGGRVK